MKKKFYLLFLPLLCTITLFAQTNPNGNFVIKGQVVDSLLNETVPYATLNITKADEPDKSVKRLACDIDGRFETTLIAPGEYVISMHSVGKMPAQKTFTLAENRKVLDLGKLSMDEDRQRLEEVTVIAQKPLVKVEIDKLTYSMEDDPEAETNNTLDMLRKVPMVTVDAEDKIQLKGTSNYRIYLNGKPSNMLSSDNASDVLKSMPASSVKNIEVITDPGAKYDADGVGGIINIITSRNALQGYTASVRAGVSALGRYNAGGNVSTKIGKLGITANYNYNNYRNPWNDSENFRETYSTETVFKQAGRNKSNNGHQFGSLEVSYELDSLNLLSLGANMWRGNYKGHSEFDVRALQGQNPWYEYDQYSESEGNYGSIDMNLDYQRSTRKKDELLTVSYRFSHSPNDSKGFTTIENTRNYDAYKQRNINDARTQEHTAQVDYTTPLPHNQTLEAGGKYIMRESNSESEVARLGEGSSDWIVDNRPESRFSHIQHIYAAYMGYAAKWKSFGFKAGIRAEGTALNVQFKNDRDRDFKSDFFNVVPNATLSYQLNMSQTIRLGYNMRIYRPGIWHLNPYENDTDPQNVSYGNPNLDPEKSHNLNLNYSMFTMKFNLNVGAHYRYLNNSILRYSFIDNDHPVYPGRLVSTFDNLGKEQGAGMYLYTRWAPVPLFAVYVNGGFNYIHINPGEHTGLNIDEGTVSGFNGYMYPGAEVNLPKDFRINVNGGFSTPWIQYQSKGTTFHYHSISFNKSFMDKKLNVSLSCNNPFVKDMKYTNTIDQELFYSYNKSYFRTRDFRINVSYRFGTLKESIQKVRRGITNDDSKGGGEGGSGGGGQGM